MAFRRDVVPDFANLAILSDPKGHAHDAEESLAQERLHAAGAEGLDDMEFRIRKQREIQFVLGFEFCLGFDGIAAAADNRGVEFFEFGDGVTKLGRFTRSTGRVGFREKIEDQVPAAKIRERNRFAVVVGRAEVGRLVPLFEHSVISGHIRITRADASKFH